MKLAKIQLSEIKEYIDPFAIKNFIISDRARMKPNVSPDYPFILDGVAFVICIKGSGRISVNFKEYELEKNMIITILPYFVTEVLEKSDDLMMEFLIFSTDFLTEMPASPSFSISKSIVQSACIKVSDQEIEKLLEYHSFIVRQYRRQDHPFREQMARTLLYSLLIEIGAIYYKMYRVTATPEPTVVSSHQEELISRFFKLLVEYHKKERSLEFYAGKMCLTPKYLSTVVKDRTGRTAFAWINEILVSSAKYLLKTTDYTILQISEELNFPNPSFFGRFFKKHVGITPMQYRES